jgi:hypothetical protein
LIRRSGIAPPCPERQEVAMATSRSQTPIDVPDPAPRNPGDEAAPGTPGTGENVCPACKGAGQVRGQRCVNCGGTGKVITGIGGA